MSSTLGVIENISDTALWVAYVRSLEGERKDALFRDPYARELAGERGARIAQGISNRKTIAWHVALRTMIIDEMLIETIEKQGCDTILNLAAGLDTRPYRLALPASLHWIDVDLPAILTYKAEKLAGEQPKCALEQVGLDLADISARRELFERINSQAKQVLVLIEGLSVYLTNEQLGSLVTDLRAQSRFHWLLTEFLTAGGLQYVRRSWEKRLVKGDVGIQLTLDDSETFYQKYGWKMAQMRLIAEEAEIHNRKRFFFWLIYLGTFNNPQRRQAIYRDIGGYALFEQIE
ncbi:MAG: class I SAM-dependent methyltransferase [Chloroflexi bacterium]|nr:class I SAM-dependent methyltransferase [Chloroflexota bacterium]